MDTMKKLFLAALAAALTTPHALMAEGLTLGTGFDYTTGKYGGSEKTDILYLPFYARSGTAGTAPRRGSTYATSSTGRSARVIASPRRRAPAWPMTSGRRSLTAADRSRSSPRFSRTA